VRLKVTHGVALWPWEGLGLDEGFGGLVWALGEAR
jgi:hypothetical protein